MARPDRDARVTGASSSARQHAVGCLDCALVRRIAGAWVAIAPAMATGCSLLLPIHEHDASADGGASSDARVDGSALRDGGDSRCSSSFLFCEGFEGSLAGAWEELTSQGGTVAADGTRAYRGERALHARIPAQSVEGEEIAATVLHAQRWPDHFFVRWFSYVVGPVNAATNLLNMTERTNGIGLQLFILGDPVERFLVTVQYGLSTDRQITSTATFPIDQWVCLEAEVDAPNQLYRQWMNGVAVDDLTQPFAAPVLDAITVGLEVVSSAAGPARDAFVDELAVDAVRIGCDR
jgi:hypothetical protein